MGLQQRAFERARAARMLCVPNKHEELVLNDRKRKIYKPLVNGTTYDPYTVAQRASQLPILDDLSNKLATIFVIRLIIGNIKEALIPYLRYWSIGLSR